MNPISNSEARKRRQPEVEYDPAVLQSQLDWERQVSAAAMTNHRKADKGRVEALARVEELGTRIAHLERSMRAVVLMLKDDQPATDVIQTISDALEVSHD